jgi:hypothetical protein
MEKKPRQGETDQETKKLLLKTRDLAKKITIQVPHRVSDGIHPKLVEYGIQWINAGMALMPILDSFGGFVDVLRASMCHEFLKQCPDRNYLIMLDNDVVPLDPESVLRLCSHDLPVVSGVVPAISPGVGMFACVSVKDDAGTARFPTVQDTVKIPGQGLRELDTCGAGFLAIRRDVLESMHEAPFIISNELRREAAKIGHLRVGEDIFFCEQVKRAGHKIYVDFSVQAVHMHSVPLRWPEEDVDDSLDPADWDVTRRALTTDSAKL